MPIVSAIVVFSLCWWALLFIALPIGVRVPDQPEVGHAASAPANPNLKPKLFWVTLLSLLFTMLWVAADQWGWIDWRQVLGL